MDNKFQNFSLKVIFPYLCRAPCRHYTVGFWVGGALYVKIDLKSSDMAWNESDIYLTFYLRVPVIGAETIKCQLMKLLSHLLILDNKFQAISADFINFRIQAPQSKTHCAMPAR